MRSAYDSRYLPPAPCVEFRLSAPEQAFSGATLRALVDTGADATIVPFRYIRPFGLQVDNRKYLRSQFGERVKVDVYLLDVGIADIRLPLMEIIADEIGNEILVGRNVLNRLMMVLDGPRQILELSG
jgi:predicted aspartyl protease